MVIYTENFITSLKIQFIIFGLEIYVLRRAIVVAELEHKKN